MPRHASRWRNATALDTNAAQVPGKMLYSHTDYQQDTCRITGCWLRHRQSRTYDQATLYTELSTNRVDKQQQEVTDLVDVYAG